MEDTAFVSLIGPANVNEGDSTTDYTVSLDNTVPAGGSVTVNFTYTGTATDGSDYTSQGSVTIAAGASSTTFNLATIDDLLADNGETIVVTIDSVVDNAGSFEAVAIDGAADSVTTTIADNTVPGTETDAETALVSISGPANVVEGETTTDYTVSVDQLAANVVTPITVNLTYSGVALDGTDFTGLASVVIAAGTNSSTFSLATIDDALAEGTESFTVTIGTITDTNFEAIEAHATNNAVTTTITDQTGTDTPPGVEDTALISIAGPSDVVEGETTTDYTVSVDQLAANVTTPITVNFTYSGVAINGTDFTGVGSAVIAAGTNSQTFSIASIDDALAEDAESFTVTIGAITDTNFEAIAANPAANAVTTTITDQVGSDNPPGPEDTVTVSLSGPSTVNEGDITSDYTISLDNTVPVGNSVTINFTYTGTATDGTDYTGQGSVVITGGNSSATFSLPTIDDGLAEGDETVIVTISSVVDTDGSFESLVIDGAANSVTTTILDNDAAPVAIDDMYITDEDTAISGNVITDMTGGVPDSDADGDILTVTSVNGAAANVGAAIVLTSGASLTVNADGSYNYDPTTSSTYNGMQVGESANETITYTISDGNGNFDTATVSFTVNGLNDPPVAVDDHYSNPVLSAALSALEDTTLTIDPATLLANDFDIDGDAINITSISLTDMTQGTLNTTTDINGFVTGIEFIPTPDSSGEVGFSYTITDGTASTSANGTISVDAVADPATVTGATIVTNGFAYSVAGDKVTTETVLYQIDLNTGAIVKIGLLDPVGGQNYDIESLAYNDQDGFLYGFANTGGARVIVQIDPMTGLGTEIQSFDTTANMGSTFANGYIYTFTKDGGNSELFLVDINDLNGDGNTEAVSLGTTSGGAVLNSLAYNTENDTFYAIANVGSVNQVYIVSNISEDTSISPVLTEFLDSTGDPVTLSSATASLAYGQNGLLWTTDRVTGEVFSIDPVTGEVRIETSLNVSDVTADGFENLVILPDGGSRVAAGDQFSVSLNATFGDYTDGSESHFILLEVQPGFTLVNSSVTTLAAGNQFGVPAGDYFVFDADTVIDTATGEAMVNVFLQAPADDDPLAPSLDNYDLPFYGVSIEDPVDLTTGGSAGNNLAVVADTVAVQVFSGSPINVGTASSNVSEEGLVDGVIDTAGVLGDPDPTTDTTDATVATGTVSIVDPDGDTITSVVLTAPADGAFTSGGFAVNWTGSGTSMLTATANGTTVATLSIDLAGDYTFNLLAPFDHVDDANQEGLLGLNFGISATSAGITTTASSAIVINIEDDSPVTGPVMDTFNTLDSNVSIILDVSGSMSNSSGIDVDGDGSNDSRLEAAIDSIRQLLDQYEALGVVKVQLVTFSSGATTHNTDGNVWMTITEANAVLDTLSANGWTDYETALNEMQSTYAGNSATDVRIDGAQNVSYFLSDGVPEENGNPSPEIDPATESAWIDFLAAEEINSYALGIGTGITSADELDPVAYDGQGLRDTDGVLVTDFADLDAVLSGTIIDTTATGFLSGSLVEGIVFGADDGYLESLSTNAGSTYTYNNATNTLTSSDQGGDSSTFDAATSTVTITDNDDGVLSVNFSTGAYTFVAPLNVEAGDGGTIFNYVLVDNDGDRVSESATFTVETTNVIVDSGSITGTTGADLVIGRTSPGAPLGTAVVNGTVAPGNTFIPQSPGQLAFNYLSGVAGVTVASITINLRAGSDGNAVFDMDGLSGGGGPALVTTTGLNATDITFSPDVNGNNSSTLTVSFADGSFGVGSGFTFNVDTDSLNAGGTITGDDGAAYSDSGVTFTVDYSDGSTETVTYVSDGADGSTAATSTAITDVIGVVVDGGDGDDIILGTVADDTLDGGTGDDRLEGKEGDDILSGGSGNNILTGGLGNDIIVDDSASHSKIVFNFADVGSGVDTVYGFDNITGGLSAGTEGDALDISDILTSAGYSGAGDASDIATLSQYIDVSHDAGTGDVTIGIDTSGTGTTYSSIAILHNETAMGSSASTGIDNTVTLQQLLDNGVLITI
ncbi:Ig-like domain-containing protein [Sulfuriflexus sp.]|uniref:Ig-like domain-containing protein n=1 Tax=Sulfuriflexus sp. TaxID=2015443 RepID=UPI0028CBE52B|nr:Ig-like domain-containing protein [Sulfuriflexus sp.]MDT8404183.1 Ig-like domain-containing protein [Sulfuriflexus sp.]